MRFLRALLALLIVVGGWPSPIEAKGNRTLRVIPYVLGSSCAFYGADNGCSTAQPFQIGSAAVFLGASALQPGGMINQLTNSPTNYATGGPVRNQSGITYPAGSFLPVSSLGDPLNLPGIYAGSTDNKCVYSATGGAGGVSPRMTCTPSALNMDILNYDWTRGGTTCIPLVISGNGTGLVHVSGNYWLNNGYCAINSIFGAIFTTGFNTGATVRSTGPTLFDYNTIDLNQINFPFDYYGPCLPASGLTAGVKCNPGTAYLGTGAFVSRHNAVLHAISNIISYTGTDNTVGELSEYNYVQGCCTQQLADHAEFSKYQPSGSGAGAGGAGQWWKGNTFIQTTAHMNNGETALPGFLGTGVNPPQIPTVPIYSVTDNFFAVGGAGGATPGTSVAGAMTINTSTFVTSTITGGKFGSGEGVTCGGTGNESDANTVTITAFYPGSTGTTSAGPGGGGWSNTTGAGGSSWPAIYQHGQVSAGIDDGGANLPSYTGTLSANTLTVTGSVTGGTIAIGQTITGAGVTPAVITAGSGISWTYNGGVQSVSTTLTNHTPGNTLTVATDDILTLDIGSLVNGRQITAKAPTTNPDTGLALTGTGATGTYTVGGTAIYVAASSNLGAAPNNIFPGNWSVPTAANCPSKTPPAVPWGTAAWMYTTGSSFGQITSVGNYIDAWVFGAGGPIHVMPSSSGNRVFNGTITSPSTLTVNSGTAPGLLWGLFVQAGIPAGTYLASGTTPTFTLGGNTFGSTVGPVSMTAALAWCQNQTIWGTAVGDPNEDMSGLNTEAQMNQFTTNNSGNNCGP